MRTMLPVFFVVCFLAVPHASAHYLWVTVQPRQGEADLTKIFFEGSPAPGDGRYLDHFVDSRRVWLQSPDNEKPQALEVMDVTEDKKRWLQAGLPAKAPRSIDAYARFGVYRYGQTDVLLHYYGRNLEVRKPDDLAAMQRAKHLNLELVPRQLEDTFELGVLWRTKPVAGRPVHIRGPKGFSRNINTDENGVVQFKVGDPGRYIFRTSVEEAESGKDGDQEYSLIRHHGTLMMKLPLDK